MSQPVPSGETAPSFTLQVGSRTLVIDNSQGMGSPFVLLAARKLGKPNDRCLVIRSSSWWKVVTAVGAPGSILLPVLGLLYELGTVDVENDAWMLCFWALMGWGLTAEARFDRGAGLLIHGRLGWRGRRPLADILAVQLFHYRARWGASRYQLFLILDDARRPRRLVLNCLVKKRNRTWVRQVAGQLAEFLGVPMVDQISAP